MPSSPRKPEPVLDERLSAAAAYVRPGARMADIGCDHGKLCAALAARGTCEKIFACDIREKPLARARELLAPYLASGLAECRLGDGLTVLTPGEATDIVIAGVSGVTACQILEAGESSGRRASALFLSRPQNTACCACFWRRTALHCWTRRRCAPRGVTIR